MRVSLVSGDGRPVGRRGACAFVNWWWQLRISWKVTMTRHQAEQQGRTGGS